METLREARKAAGISQRDLAWRLGISAQYLSDIERGRREFPAARYADLPMPVRAPMVRRAIAYHRDAIAQLQAMLRK